MDSDAAAYITAVESADGATLPTNIKNAIDAFVVGCKADSNWTKIKSACLFAGPATLLGSLVPLVGVAHTNSGFVSGDHSQFFGLQGDGTKSINTNRADNADPQNDCHQSVWVSAAATAGSLGAFIGSGTGSGGTHLLADRTVNNWIASRHRSGSFGSISGGGASGFIGHSRSASASYTLRVGGSSVLQSIASSAASGSTSLVFSRGSIPTNARLAAYTIGESVDLALLDARLTTYMAAIAITSSGIIPILRQHYAAMGAR
jgi:hypothetical protein